MKRLTKGFLSFIMMASYALGMSAQDATVVPADEIPSSLRDAASLKLTGTWGTSAFAELKMAPGKFICDFFIFPTAKKIIFKRERWCAVMVKCG